MSRSIADDQWNTKHGAIIGDDYILMSQVEWNVILFCGGFYSPQNITHWIFSTSRPFYRICVLAVSIEAAYRTSYFLFPMSTIVLMTFLIARDTFVFTRKELKVVLFYFTSVASFHIVLPYSYK